MSSSTPNIGLTLPVGGEKVSRQIINENNTKIDTYAGEVNTGLDGLRDGIAIVADGNTHAAITSGQFVYVKNHQTLSEGLYTASTNIAANAALSGSNLTADPKGGLNALSEQIAKSASSPISNVYVQRMGDVVILCFSNAFMNDAIPLDGYTIQYTATNIAVFPCFYYSGDAQTGNVTGFLKVQDNKLYLLDSTMASISKTYISGTVVFVNA